MSSVSIREADRVEITILTDNYTDMLMIQNTDVLRRPQIRPPRALYAEHGLSCLVRVGAGTEEHVLLMDAGITPECLVHNAGVLQVDPGGIESVMLSHGHFDHFGGLTGLPGWLRPGTPLFLHPDAFLPRRLNNPAIGPPIDLPPLDESALCSAGVDVASSRSPVSLASGLLSTTGEVDRKTPFEKGFPLMQAQIGGQWTVDPFRDDQGLVASVKGKGLVVISGCAHAGIINTVEHAKKMTGIAHVHAVLGGFHLSGPIFEPIVPATIAGMQRIHPDYLIPMHCTGWKAINGFAAAMPGPCILNTVGTTYVFQGS
jgi:7,8-dihydropterin-6-yl-methyl-4-(beta-D-ribofuranosyl)aminobenzene 5'-phosphate synthase